MSTRLFVGNIDRNVTEDALEEFLSEAGEVVAVRIPRDRDSGARRGYAFVEYRKGEQAERAIEALDGAVLEGRRIRLQVANEKPRRGGGRPRERARDRDSDEEEDGWEEPRGRRDREGDDSSKRRDRQRRRGKHGSDRIRGRGTRRFID